MEITYKRINDFPDYFIGNNGEVLSLKGKKVKILKRCISIRGYYVVGLLKNGQRKVTSIHRLLAEGFIPKIKNKTHVNHKDMNKLNNELKNLEWCNNKENQIHAWKNGRKPHPNSNKNYALGNPKKPIVQIKNGIIIKKFDSLSDASREGFGLCQISKCCNKKAKFHKGFEWQFQN